MIVGGGPLFTGGDENLFHPVGGVHIEEGLVTEVAPFQELVRRYPDEERYDTQGNVILPGMLCAHHHLYSTFARGMALLGDSPATFGQILEKLWWKLDKALTLEDVYISALVPLIECIRSGTTGILDHHASPHAVRGSLSAISRAVEESGIRACLCYEVSDRDGLEIAQEGLEENEDFIANAQRENSDFLTATFGLHASLTLSDKTLERAVEIAQRLGVGFHIHAAEGIEDVEDSLRRSGKRVIERLEERGILGPKTLAAHCIHLDERELDLLERSDTMVAHNPSSNMNNAVGYARIPEMVERGILVGLGTDGMTSDLFSELRLAFLLEKTMTGDPRMGWEDIRALYMRNNPRIFGRYFPRSMGELKVGAYGDLIILDYRPPTPFEQDSFLGHLFFAISSRHVDSTMVGGRFLMKERKLQVLDEAEVAQRSRELAGKLWGRLQ
jgi:putative selenium metabolism protein SsnA